MHSQPRLAEAFATARITAFKPGQSPPPVTTPIRLLMWLLYCLCGQPGAAVFADECDAFIHRLYAMRNFKIDLACEFVVFPEHRAPSPITNSAHIFPTRIRGVLYSLLTCRSCHASDNSKRVPIPPGTTTKASDMIMK